jgi:geranylgeranyl diphosphate synthase, type II
MIDIDRYLENEQVKINEALGNCLPDNAPAAVINAMRYSLEAGGKRLRPILTIAVAKTLGNVSENLYTLACAVEMIHTYSLIHDDLPAMDNSDLRRGKPTCHRIYGDAVAILAGDALLTLAFQLVSQFGMREERAVQANRISAELAAAAGAAGMIGGQILDLEAEGSDPTLEQLELISALKTGALIRASVLSGAIASNASDREIKALSAYAESCGKAFQVVDDILDYEGNREDLGKPTGADLARRKATYPALLGIDGSRVLAEKLYDEAINALAPLSCNLEILSEIARKLVYRVN